MRLLSLAATSLCLAACAAPSDGGARRAAASSPAEGQTAGSVPLASVEPLRVVVLGNSIAAGYGLAAPRRDAFPGRLQQRLDSLGWPFRVEAAAVSGSTTSGGLDRLGAALAGEGDGAAVGARPGRVAVLVVELGGNDVFRFVPPDRVAANLREIVARARRAHPGVRVLVTGVDVPTALVPGGLRHPIVDAYRRAFTGLADSTARVTVLPTIVGDVIGVRGMTQPDGIHPTAEGQRRIEATVWTALRPLLADVLREAGVAEAEIAAGA